MDIQKLTELANKKGTWPKADKDWLLPVLAEYGVDAPTKTSCSSCWRDAAIMVLRQVKQDDKPEPANGKREFKLKGDAATAGVFWRGRFIHPSTLSPTMIDWLLKNGFPPQHYEN